MYGLLKMQSTGYDSFVLCPKTEVSTRLIFDGFGTGIPHFLPADLVSPTTDPDR